MKYYQHKQTADDTVFSENHLRTMWVRDRFTLHNQEFDDFMDNYQYVVSRERYQEPPKEGQPEKPVILDWKTPEEWEEFDRGNNHV